MVSTLTLHRSSSKELPHGGYPESQELRTDRLLLRRWRAEDLEPFAAMGVDARVMEFFPALLSREESAARVGRIEAHFNQHGFGLWAVEVVDGASFIGFVGLWIPTFEAPFTPCVEVGWRLGAEHWGRGYATEGARAAVAFGFETLQLDEIVSYGAGEWAVAAGHGEAGDAV